jgi:hypothetical protein
MCSWVMLAEAIGLVEGSFLPTNVELLLAHAIMHPAELHVHCLGAFLLDGIVFNASCCTVVGFNRGRLLWVSHFLKCRAQGTSFFSVETIKF